MATQLPLQDYLFASEIAYKNDPAADLKTFMPNYTLAGRARLGNGFQAYILEAGGESKHALFAFRGTLPDFQATLHKIAEVEADAMIISQSSFPSQALIQKYASDSSALQRDPMIQDLRADAQIFAGAHVEQFFAALGFVQDYVAKNQKTQIYVTGHSLGGGIAEFVAGQRVDITGTTFAAPGYRDYGNASAATMINYYNVNDTIPTVNLKDHCGQTIPLDILHSSFAVENRLGQVAAIVQGFNGVPNPTTALTNNQNVIIVVAKSLGFLVARLIYHQLPNYAGLLNCRSITGKPTRYTIDDFAAAARDALQDSLWAQRQWHHPIHGMWTFTFRLLRRTGRVILEIGSAYGQAEIEMAQDGLLFTP